MARAKMVSCFLVTGSDETGVKKAARARAEVLAPGADAFGLEVIDGGAESVDVATSRIEETIGAVLTLPFLGGSKTVWLKSANFLSDTVTGRSESVLSAVERLCDILEAGLPDGVLFLMSAIAPDKRRAGYRRLTKLCDVEIFDMPDLGFRAGEEGIVEWTATQTRKQGLRLAPDAVEALAARVGVDTAQLANELEKLETSFGKNTPISAQDIRLLVPQTREGGIFDLSGAILKRDLPLALDTLAQLMKQGEKGVSIILAAIVPTVRNLLLMKDLMQRHRIPSAPYNQFTSALGRLAATETGHLPRKKDGTLNTYPLSLAASHASHFSLPELEHGFRACAEAARQLFGGPLGEDVVLARLLMELLSRRDSRPTA